MNCPKCDAEVPADDINLQSLVGMCRRCNEVFRVLDQLPEKPASPRARYPRPASIVVVEDGDSRAMQYRWFKPVFLFLLFFCIAWDSFLIFWYATAIAGPGNDGFGIIMVIFPILHVAVGIGLTYFVICGFVNRTVIGITGDLFFVRHRPMPFFGNKTLPAGSLREVYVEVTYHTNRHSRGRVSETYTVAAVTDDGQRHKIVSALELPETRFIMQQINDWLDLKPSALGLQ